MSDFDIEELIKMHKLCRQVSIESPGSVVKDCVFSFVVPVPDTPEFGARVKVINYTFFYRWTNRIQFCSEEERKLSKNREISR